MYTMCPPGYHYNGFMATPALGRRMIGYTLGISLWTYQSASTASRERCMYKQVVSHKGTLQYICLSSLKSAEITSV